jgi:hypothetical protein
VSPQGRIGFENALQTAKATLTRAALLAPDDPTPHALLIRVGSGLGDLELARRSFAAAGERDPDNLLAHSEYLVVLAQRWHGSHNAMFELARSTAARASLGSNLHVLIPMAHVERWLYAAAFDGMPGDAKAWIGVAKHQDEVRDAWQNSLGAASYRPDALTPLVRSWFAFWFYLVADRARVTTELRQLNDRVTRLPWCWGPAGNTAAANLAAAKRLVG